MAIVAVLLALGAGGFISVRNSSEVDAVAEDLVSAIRGAQNQAISIQEGGCDSSEGTTKVWRVQVRHDAPGGDDIYLRYVCGIGTTTYTDSDLDLTSGLSSYKNVQIVTPEGNNPSSVYFSTPFGKGYVYPGYGPSWSISNSVTQDWVPSPAGSTTPTIWTVQKNGYQRVITIQPNGDVSEQ